MPRTSKVCGASGCPEIVTGTNYCDEHAPKKWEGSTWNDHRPKGWDKTRAYVLRRDNNTCTYCGAPATQVDHIIPVSQGGSHKLSNLTAACRPCNLAKNNREKGIYTRNTP